MPMAYLNVENPRGFRKTKEWWQKSIKQKAQREVVKVIKSSKLSDYDKFYNTVKLFNKHRNIEYYDYCIGYIRKIIPQYAEHFTKIVRQTANV
jgi:hypothetical protein